MLTHLPPLWWAQPINVVTNATVKPSNTTPLRTLTPDTNGVSLRFEERFDSQAALDSVYPTTSGFSAVSYTTTMHTVNFIDPDAANHNR